MCFHGAHRNFQRPGHVLVRLALRQLQQDRLFAFCQRLARAAVFGGQRPLRPGAQIWRATHNRVDGQFDFVGGHILEQIPHGAVTEGGGDIFRVVMHRQDHDAGLGVAFQHDFCGRQPADIWHVEVHQDHIRGQRLQPVNDGAAIGQCRDNLDIVITFEDGLDAFSDHRVIIDNCHADGLGHWAATFCKGVAD